MVWANLRGNYQSCCCSVAKLCPTLCNPMGCSTPGSPVLHFLLEFAQTHVYWVGDAIQPESDNCHHRQSSYRICRMLALLAFATSGLRVQSREEGWVVGGRQCPGEWGPTRNQEAHSEASWSGGESAPRPGVKHCIIKSNVRTAF